MGWAVAQQQQLRGVVFNLFVWFTCVVDSCAVTASVQTSYCTASDLCLFVGSVQEITVGRMTATG
jgi:hypothetical protein